MLQTPDEDSFVRLLPAGLGSYPAYFDRLAETKPPGTRAGHRPATAGRWAGRLGGGDRPRPGDMSTALGLRANLGQFGLLVAVNALVGSMVGQEQTVLPLLAEREFA